MVGQKKPDLFERW